MGTTEIEGRRVQAGKRLQDAQCRRVAVGERTQQGGPATLSCEPVRRDEAAPLQREAREQSRPRALSQWDPDIHRGGEEPTDGGFFITTYPARSRCLTSRCATMSAFRRSESCWLLRPSCLNAKESVSARSSGWPRVSLGSGSVMGEDTLKGKNEGRTRSPFSFHDVPRRSLRRPGLAPGTH